MIEVVYIRDEETLDTRMYEEGQFYDVTDGVLFVYKHNGHNGQIAAYSDGWWVRAEKIV
jgi:hypothetical protein